MLEKINKLLQEVEELSITGQEQLEEYRIKWLSRKGEITTLFDEFREVPAELKKEGINGADYHYSVFKKNPDWIDIAKQQKILLNAWTVNEKTDLEWLLKNKFEYITTNEPELLLGLTGK